ncbi:MAG: penicillin acylase family protein, partial [Planctomycetota bacterium]
MPDLDSAHDVQGITRAVTIARDHRGRASIEAETFEDAAFALGFCHAQDRLFQLDMLRRFTLGELSELLGVFGLPMDRRHRTLGFPSVAASVLASVDADLMPALSAYTLGVNAGIESLPGLPPEYRVLNTSPRRWTEKDSIAVVLFLHIALSGDYDIENLNAALRASLPSEVLAFLLPERQRFDAAMTGRDWAPSDAPPIPSRASVDWRGLAPDAFGPRPGEAWPIDTVPIEDTLGLTRGSNAWAVDASRSADGRAMLASDMHLPLTAPNVWYPVELAWGGGGFPRASTGASERVPPAPRSSRETGQSVGLSIPGFPAVIAGSNGRVAWASTNLLADVYDRAVIEPIGGRIAKGAAYHTPDGPEPFRARTETITVRGGEPHVFDVFDTRWGPVAERTYDGLPVAVAWTAIRPALVNLAAWRFMFAEDVDDAVAVASRSGLPLNSVLADATGRVAWVAGGSIPTREGIDRTMPNRWSGGHGWTGTL